VISSASNPSFRRWLDAKERSDRKSGELLLEGFHLMQAWSLRYPLPHCIIVAEAFKMTAELQTWLVTHPIPLEIVSNNLFAKLSSLETFSGPIALVSPKRSLLGEPDPGRGDLVFLDRIQDPGNLGTILRSCAALGVSQIALSAGTVWPWSAKVLRAGMSAHFSLDIYDEFEIERLLALKGFQLLVTSGQESLQLSMIDEVDLTSPSIWCFGNEGSGLRPSLLDAPAANKVSIPQSVVVESLNVASALSICLYEQQRQRRAHHPRIRGQSV
jgi:RNA methyltransferase, TrmH family